MVELEVTRGVSGHQLQRSCEEIGRMSMDAGERRVSKCGRGETRIMRGVAKGVDHIVHAKRGWS